MGGPPWTLEGSFMFTLSDRLAGVAGFPGDSLVYTHDIRITVPVPASLSLTVFGLCLLALAAWRGRRLEREPQRKA